jgi:hypothetical protein
VATLRSRLRAWMVSLGLVGGLAVAVSLGMTLQYGAPVPIAPPGNAGPSLGHDHGDDQDYMHHEIEEKQMKMLREQHQKELFSDTARMLQLATALKAEVDKGDQTTLAADVVKQADEIGRLAKRVSERIKTQ